MFRHVVMFRWAEAVDDEHVADVAARLDTLPATIDVIRRYEHGRDARFSEGNFDYVVVADFDSAEDYVAYRDHPAHTAFIAALIAGSIAERSAVQYHLDDPTTTTR